MNTLEITAVAILSAAFFSQTAIAQTSKIAQTEVRLEPAGGTGENDLFGGSVAVSTNGSTLVVSGQEADSAPRATIAQFSFSNASTTPGSRPPVWWRAMPSLRTISVTLLPSAKTGIPWLLAPICRAGLLIAWRRLRIPAHEWRVESAAELFSPTPAKVDEAKKESEDGRSSPSSLHEKEDLMVPRRISLAAGSGLAAAPHWPAPGLPRLPAEGSALWSGWLLRRPGRHRERAIRLWSGWSTGTGPG